MKNDWFSCDGNGNQGGAKPNTQRPTPDTPKPNTQHPIPFSMTRRSLLLGGALAGLGWASREMTALADLSLKPNRKEPEGDILVNIFLRGGADGLNIIVPHGEDAYRRHRPVVGVPGPKEVKASPTDRVIDLDGFFGLHPALHPIEPLFKEGKMAAVHAVGSGDQSRSHFEAMATMERGIAADTGTASGWIARHLSSTETEHASPLRAVAFSSIMPDSLRGATDATAINSLADFRLYLPPSKDLAQTEELHKALAEFYAEGKDAVTQAGRETLAVLETLKRIDPANYKPSNGAAYPNSPMGNGLKQVACLIRGKVGLEIAFLDRGGWDMHYGQNLDNWMFKELNDVAKCLEAFTRDLGTEFNRVTMVLMTEFGRRVEENKTLGTDHGRGSMMLLAGGSVNGGKVYGKWPGLEKHQLEDPGDLKVTTDYRDVLAEVISKRLKNQNVASVFPEFAPKQLGVVRG